MFSRLATYLAIHLSCPKSRVLADIYGRLNICLVRAVARATSVIDFLVAIVLIVRLLFNFVMCIHYSGVLLYQLIKIIIVCRRVGAAAEAAENRKHTANDPKCAELGWRCVPLAVETYCNWGEEARRTFTLLATRLAFGSSSFRKARVISDMFGRLIITLVRAIARAILARNVIPTDFN